MFCGVAYEFELLHTKLAAWIKKIFLRFVIRFRTQTQNHGIAVDIINSAGIAYHQHEVLYIIKPQIDAR